MQAIYSQICTVRKLDEKYEYNIQQYLTASAALSSAIQQLIASQNVDYNDILTQAQTCQ